METSARAMWVALCATEAQLDKVIDDARTAFPPYLSLIREVETKLGGSSDPDERKEIWKRLCSAAHSGTEQLLSHTDVTGRMGPSFDLENAKALIRVVTGEVILLAVLQIDSMGRRDLAHEVEELYDSLGLLHSEHTVGPIVRPSPEPDQLR